MIVDLDDTLWSGIVGEVGVGGISWHQELHTQVHALLQQMLAQMAENGVLLAVASKNEPETVRQALARSDLLVSPDAFFPIIASWGPKSAAVNEILRVWNVGADSVVFLDDNPMELSEVQAAQPGVTGLRFNPKDPAAVWDVLLQLRDLFGKPAVFEEDRLRRDSIRASAALQDLEQRADSGGFLQTLAGRLTIDYRKDAADKRPLELINKTNQFNLNGIRITEGDWLAGLRDSNSIAAVVSYEDKFGSLGKIAVLLGRNGGLQIAVTSWVMSCRAFARRIEHHTLDSLFRLYGVDELLFDFRPTERNQPLQQFFQEIGASCRESGQLRLTRQKFLEARRGLPHNVMESRI